MLLSDGSCIASIPNPAGVYVGKYLVNLDDIDVVPLLNAKLELSLSELKMKLIIEVLNALTLNIVAAQTKTATRIAIRILE